MNAKTSLLERIKTLGEKARAIHENPDSFKDGFAKWEAGQKALETELIAIDKEAGKGLVVGRCLTFGVADGSATYLVTKIRKNDVVVEWVPLYDGYWSQAVGLNRNKTEWIVNRHTAESYCRFPL